MAGGSIPIVVQTTAAPSESGVRNKYMAPLVVLSSLFFIWGFLTCLNDIIIPHLKAVFDLNYAQAMLIQFAFFAAYFVVSLPSGFVVNRVGYKNGIIIGLVIAGAGCFLFYPAAGQRSYALFLLALFVLASGITLLQVAANPFVAVLGKPETASSRLTLTQALNSLGTTIAPIFGSLIILSAALKSPEEIRQLPPAAAEAYRLAEASAVQTPYVGLAIALMLLAGAMALFKLPTINAARTTLRRPLPRDTAAPQRLELPAPGAGRGGDLRLRRRGGCHRQLPGELLQGARTSAASPRRRAPATCRSTGAARWSVASSAARPCACSARARSSRGTRSEPQRWSS